MNTIPKGLKINPRQSTDYVKGISSVIPYLVRNGTGDWRPYLPTYRQQKFGSFDSNCCWAVAFVNDLATQCNFLMAKGQFPADTIKWFTDNGYLDQNGLFAFSELFVAINSGVRDNGNDHIEAWRLSRINGVLPRANLTYTDEQASRFGTQVDFANDYFNPAKITAAMRQKALDSKKYIDIAYEWVGNEFVQPNMTDMLACLKHSPIQVGVPVCMQTWNSGAVKTCGDNDLAHSVMIDNIESDGIKDFRDQYHPEDKTFDATYPILMVTHGVVTPILKAPYVPPTTAVPYEIDTWSEVWAAVWTYFRTKINL